MPRSMMDLYDPFRTAGIGVMPYAAAYSVPKVYKISQNEWIPNMWCLSQSAGAWHEYLGMLEVWITRLF